MHHLFVDFENVQDIDLGALGGDPVELTVILGKDQKPPPSRLLATLLERTGALRLIKLEHAGRNALDMSLAAHVGAAAARDPSGTFHILSEDRDYDPLIAHLRLTGIDAVRVGKSPPPAPVPAPAAARPAPSRPETRTAVPAAGRPAPNPPESRAAASSMIDKATNVANRLRRSANPPSRKARLLSHIRDQLKGRIGEGDENEILDLLVESGFVAIDTRNRVTYPGLAAAP